jgi:hypothetical protein
VSANPFAYVGDNPLGDVDPNGTCGLFDWGCYGKAVSTVGKAITNTASHVYNHYIAPVAKHVYNRYIKPALHYGAHLLKKAVHFVKDVYHAAKRFTQRAVPAAYTLYNKVKRIASNAYHRVVAGVKKRTRCWPQLDVRSVRSLSHTPPSSPPSPPPPSYSPAAKPRWVRSPPLTRTARGVEATVLGTGTFVLTLMP